MYRRARSSPPYCVHSPRHCIALATAPFTCPVAAGAKKAKVPTCTYLSNGRRVVYFARPSAPTYTVASSPFTPIPLLDKGGRVEECINLSEWKKVGQSGAALEMGEESSALESSSR